MAHFERLAQMMRRLALPSLASLALAALAMSSCSGSGGGGAAAGGLPSLVSAVFTGSSTTDTTPDPGDKITFYFTRDVKLAPGVVLDDSQIELSNGTLGTGLGGPKLVDARTVEVTLGTGTSFTVGTDTIKLNEDQTVILTANEKAIDVTTIATIQLSDGARPTVSFVTVNSAPMELNGTGPAGGTMRVPRTGFTIGAKYEDGAGTIDTHGFVMTANRDIRAGGILVLAGENFASKLEPTNVTATEGTWTVTSSVIFGEGDHVVSIAVRDSSGNLSLPATYSFTVRTPSKLERPLEAGQNWYIDFSRDLETLSSQDGAGSFVIIDAPVSGPNGTSDFFEDLRILGARTDTPLADVDGGRDSNQVTFNLMKDAIKANLDEFFGAATKVEFTFNDPGEFPGSRPFVDYDKYTHSRIAVGGATTISGAQGTAIFDSNNRSQENNALDVGAYGGVVLSARLGVFIHTMIAADINRSGSKLRADFDPFIRFRGTPIGEDSGDKARLQNILASTNGDSRQTAMITAIDNLSRFIAVLLAHECGHSMGLVEDGAMPAGLYGGLPAFFSGSTSGHIDLSSTSIFASPATEIMTASVSYESSVDANTNFNPLLRAYLREQLYYDAK